jgi:hypothetical protein
MQKEAAIESYETRDTRVRELLPSDKLLDYSVKEGWAPLCNFLEIGNCPTHPFPKINSARSVQVQAVSAAITPLFLVLFVIFYGLTTVFQKATGRTVLEWINFQTIKIPAVLHKVMTSSTRSNDKRLQGQINLRRKED